MLRLKSQSAVSCADQPLNLDPSADFERSELHDVTERIVKRSDAKGHVRRVLEGTQRTERGLQVLD